MELIQIRPHELCESIKDFLISAFISYMIDPISGACFVQDMVAIMTAYRTASRCSVFGENVANKHFYLLQSVLGREDD